MTREPTSERVAGLGLDHLHKHYANTHAVADVSLTVAPGETVALLGPSGCGKSTLLRLVAGLERPDAGRVTLGDRDITQQPAQQRGFGMVFQDFALFPHLNVANNVAFGLVEQGWSAAARQKRVGELLELVGLAGFETRRVPQLSGGEQQRVSLARALAPQPSLLLLDEPLSNLDVALREELKVELADLLGSLETGAIYVTHDQSEAFTLADRVALMRRGRLEQIDTPGALFAAPNTLWAAQFLGHQNLYPLSEHAALQRWLRHVGIDTDTPNETLLLRNDLVTLERLKDSADVDHKNTGRADTGREDVDHDEWSAKLRGITRVGALYTLRLWVSDLGIALSWSGFARELPDIDIGDEVRLGIPRDALVLLAKNIDQDEDAEQNARDRVDAVRS